jgi:nitroreductase
MSRHPKTAAPDHDILDVIRERWSPRAYDAARPVPRADLLRLFEAARWAPSSGNEQPWRFIAADRAAHADGFRAIAAALTGKNPLWAAAAPVLVVVAVRRTLERDESVNQHAWYDTGQAVALLSLQATSMGLAARQMEGFDRERVRQACAIPPPFEPAVVVAIGYAGDPASLTYDKHREAERQPRSRRRIDEFVFGGAWGAPY